MIERHWSTLFVFLFASVCLLMGAFIGTTEVMEACLPGQPQKTHYNISKIVKERKLRQSMDLKIYAMTICNLEVSSLAPRQEKLRVLMTAEIRAKHCKSTLAEALLAEKQFSAWNGSDGPEIRMNKVDMQRYAKCENEAVEIMLGPREVWTANFYHATYIPKPRWAEGMAPLGESGGHRWYYSEDNNYCKAGRLKPTIKPKGRKVATYAGFVRKALKKATGQEYL